ncbi:MAG: glycosyltransferase family 4 protein [Ignavibacteria bacterium]
MKKVVFITNVPAHYRVALSNHTSKLLSEEKIELIVIFNRLSYQRRKYWESEIINFEFPFYVMKQFAGYPTDHKIYEFGFGIRTLLDKIRPELIIAAGFSLQSLMVYYYSREKSIPFLLYSGETKYSAPLSVDIIRNFLRKLLIKQATGFIVYGSKAKEYIENFGRKDNIHIVINSIDTDKFAKKLSGFLPGRKSEIFRILAVGDIKFNKGYHLLFKALDLVKKNYCGKFQLQIIGNEGKYIRKLLQLRNQMSLEEVSFIGRVPYNNIPQYYANADLFVLSSIKEPFGLVMLEAAIAGLPILGSKYAGGSYELIEPGKNGFIIDPNKFNEVAGYIVTLMRNKELCKQMGEYSKNIVQNKVNINLASKQFAEAIKLNLLR